MTSTTQTIAPTTRTRTLTLRVEPETGSTLTDSEPEWLKHLQQHGYAVVSGAVPPERSAQYVDQAYNWLEKNGRGFKHNDVSTWTPEHVPPTSTAGMYWEHGINHEQFLWDLRSEPGLIEAFGKIWGTEELAVSYDCASISIPFSSHRSTTKPKPWPHVDQSPTRNGMHCIQGLVNLVRYTSLAYETPRAEEEVENGPEDGGLMVLRGSSALYEEFFGTQPSPAGGWPTKDYCPLTPEQSAWFESHGCEWVKVCAQPGDLLLWDGRCVHYGVPAGGDRSRIAAYVCYKPDGLMTPETRQRRSDAFNSKRATTHDPVDLTVFEQPDFPNVADPLLSHRAKQLAGVVSY